ncbi:MAG TPA: amidohydrolase family protein [Rhizomicrobium sp.]|nr:amidohydrolase family protein [Rhizomicrobium sp.]
MFVDRVPAKFRTRAPYIIELDNGGQAFKVESVDNPIPFGTAAVYHRATKRYDRASYKERFGELKDGLSRGVRYEDILQGSFDPRARVQEQIEGQLDGEFFYGSPGLWGAIKAMPDKELVCACFRAFNDWMAEFCSYNPARMFGLGMIPTTGIDDALAELRRGICELNLHGMVLESYPNGSLLEPAPEDDRFWALAQELGKPISLHSSIRMPANVIAMHAKGDSSLHKILAAGSFQTVTKKLILSGIFDRFPRLDWVGAEVASSWVPFYLEKYDNDYKSKYREQGVKLELLPSDYFARNVYTTFWIDQAAIANRYVIGVDRMMWMSDFPHSISNWPIDVELADAQMKYAGVTEEEKDRMMWRTTADLYRIPYQLPAEQLVAA